MVRAPYWRTDVTHADDVAEELARVVGYDKLESRPLAGAMPAPYSDPVRELRDRLRDAAVAAGLQEVITYPLTSHRDAAARATARKRWKCTRRCACRTR